MVCHRTQAEAEEQQRAYTHDTAAAQRPVEAQAQQVADGQQRSHTLTQERAEALQIAREHQSQAQALAVRPEEAARTTDLESRLLRAEAL